MKLKNKIIIGILAIIPITTLLAGWSVWEEKYQGKKWGNLMFFILCLGIPIIYNAFLLNLVASL